jgi:hypothetical protein
MVKSDAKLKILTSVFNGNNNKLIIEAIERLRDEEPFEGAIGLLVATFDRTVEKEILKAIGSFMNDLKYKSALPEVITEIRREWKPETKRMLVASCWQSGLNYSSNLSDFADTFLKGDYLTAIECFTVMEEHVHELTRKKRDEIIRRIEENRSSRNDEKETLTSELISLLKT